MKVFRHLLAILALPGIVAFLVPTLILSRAGNTRAGGPFPFPWNLGSAVLGAVFVAAGLLLMYRTVSLFITVGHGTLAPWDPPQRLVVRGIYRRVRNPMITGVFCLLLGEALAFGSLSLFYWFLLFVLANVVYIPLLEEPSLARRFGADYERYRQHVPRWVPRLRPWLPDEDSR